MQFKKKKNLIVEDSIIEVSTLEDTLRFYHK